MGWQQLSINVGDHDLESVERDLLDLGALSVTYEDAGDEPILEPAPGETPLWSQVRLVALFNESVDSDLLSAGLSGAGITDHSWSRLEDKVWERVWLDDFKPTQFGPGLWVCPHGQAPPVEGQTIIFLDPGLAFGTGRHETTALCLEWIANNPPVGQTVIDYGCGSGILGIAAARLGARRVIAIDIDEQALTATRANASANHLTDYVVVSLPDQSDTACADTVIANILAGPLISLAGSLCARLRIDGNLVLSGILAEQADEVAHAYRPWVDLDVPTTRAGWVRLSGRRNDRVHTMS